MYWWRFFIFVSKEIVRWMLLSCWLSLTYDPNGDMLIVATLLNFGEMLANLGVGLQWPLNSIH